MPVKLSPIVDSLDSVPEALRSAFEEREGRFHLAHDIEIETLADVAPLRSALAREKREGQRLAGIESSLKEWGLTIDEVRELKAERDTLKASQGSNKDDVERLRKELVDSHKTELSKRDERIKQRDSFIRRKIAESEADQAIAAAKPLSVRALRPHVLNALEVIEESEGEFEVRVVDERGKPKYSKRTGEPMTVAEFVAEMREMDDFKPLFAGNGGSGSGAEQAAGSPRSGGKRRYTAEQLKDPSVYRQLSAEAAKQGLGVFDIVEMVD